MDLWDTQGAARLYQKTFPTRWGHGPTSGLGLPSWGVGTARRAARKPNKSGNELFRFFGRSGWGLGILGGDFGCRRKKKLSFVFHHRVPGPKAQHGHGGKKPWGGRPGTGMFFAQFVRAGENKNHVPRAIGWGPTIRNKKWGAGGPPRAVCCGPAPSPGPTRFVSRPIACFMFSSRDEPYRYDFPCESKSCGWTFRRAPAGKPGAGRKRSMSSKPGARAGELPANAPEQTKHQGPRPGAGWWVCSGIAICGGGIGNEGAGPCWSNPWAFFPHFFGGQQDQVSFSRNSKHWGPFRVFFLSAERAPAGSSEPEFRAQHRLVGRKLGGTSLRNCPRSNLIGFLREWNENHGNRWTRHDQQHSGWETRLKNRIAPRGRGAKLFSFPMG